MSTPTESTAIILNKSPLLEVNYDLKDPESTFKIVQKPIEQLEAGQLLVKTLVLSNDPTQRGWIQKGPPSKRMYTKPVLPGDTMKSFALGQVIESKSLKYKVGEVVCGFLGWSDYIVVSEEGIFNTVPQSKLPLTYFLDILGLTGLTAYFGLLEVAQLKATDVVVISAASGATGSMCVQIAKHVIGCKKVIGISGTDNLKYVESIGADVAVDYKDPNFYENLEAAIGDGEYADAYFDNVGGSVLDSMLTLVKPFGTVVACGAIAGYNDSKKAIVARWSQIVINRLNVKGFLVFDYKTQYEKAIGDILRWIQEGKIKAGDSFSTIVDLSGKDDFQKVPVTWGKLFSGKGPDKLLTKIADYKQ